MLLNTLVHLEGTRKERVVKALEMAGWYSGRCVDISGVESYYNECGVELNEGARRFFREYYGLAEHWWIDRDSKPNQAADFEFSPMPNGDGSQPKDYMFDDRDYELPSEDYLNISQIANEHFVLVGSIGYYYPAEVWIGESGRIYATHEYDMVVHSFATVVDLIEWELAKQAFDCVTIQKELVIDKKPWEPGPKGYFSEYNLTGGNKLRY